MEETTWRKSHQISLQEGFNLPGDTYFINVKRQITIKTQFGNFIKKIKDLLKKIPNPISMADKYLEALLKTLLLLMIGQNDCKTGKLKIDIPDIEETTFTWANGKLNLLKNNSVSIGYDFTKKGEDNIEKFSMPDTPDLIYTIQSFLENHPKFDKTAVTTYYLKKLNAYEKSLGNTPTSAQLFNFNNEFDNILADPSVVSEIKSIADSIPKPSYPNTAEGFAEYLQNNSRFSFSNDTPITFYPFATQYFPYPTDLKGFEAAIQSVEDPNYIQNINQYLPSLTKPADPPPITPINVVDGNYAFSIDINNSRTESIQTYLKYISQWYGLLLYYKYQKSITVLFPTIEANVCMVYITYLNAVEYTKYRIYSTYLTPYEIAMFNHLFFICLMQDQLTFNVYNLASPPDGVSKDYISNGTPSVYINLLPQSIFSLVRMFAMEINNRVRYLSGSITDDNYQPLPLDGTLILPPVPNDVIPLTNVLLANYILGIFSPTPFNGVSIPEDVFPDKDITDYYFPTGMSECEEENNSMQKECEDYAKKIKGEIYRMICAPIMIYVAYNFYYMFFFKDCFNMVKNTDNAGNTEYKHKCIDCFTPIFPDWEMMYRSFEQRQTDFLFEFVFKPVKMVYTILNAFKAFFRKGFSGYVIKDNVPYLFFLWSFIYVYRFMTKRADIVLNTLKTLSKLKIPDFQIMGRKGLDSFAKGVTVIFFLFSFLNKCFGISISEIVECIHNEYLARKAAKDAAALVAKQLEGENDVDLDKEPNIVANNNGISGGAGPDDSKSSMGNCNVRGAAYENSWVKWIMTPGDGPFTKLLKFICTIIYWILKYAISMSMVRFSKFIFSLYFFVNGIMGIGNFTTPIQGNNYKLDMIHRIFYTKLCSSNYRTEPLKYVAKCFIFIPIYFLVELIILHNLMKGIKNYSSMSSKKREYNTGLSAKTNDDADKNSMAVKTFMMILNGLLVVLVLLWSIYKALYKMPILVRGYENPTDPSIDKRLEYDCSGKVDEYIESSKNNVANTIMKSDDYNKVFIEQFETRTAGMKKPSEFGGFIKKMGEYGKKINDKLTNIGETVSEYSGKTSGSIFGKKTV